MDGNRVSCRDYQCCFCSKLIESSNGDPCATDILVNIHKPKNQQYNQVFYCHMECFREQLHDDVRFHFALECLIPGRD